MATPDAAAIRRLTEALLRHRGDSEAYKRLGAHLRDRRPLLDRRYGNRSLFARERLIPLGLGAGAAYKLADQVERGFGQDREGTSVGSMLAVAAAYEVSTDEIVTALDGGEFTTPPPPARQPSRAETASERYPPVTDPVVAGRLPGHIDQVWEEVAAAAADHGAAPESLAGAQVFADPGEAQAWDFGAGVFGLRFRVRIIALNRAKQGPAPASGARTAS